MDIGFKIKDLRIKMGLTQEELANRCDLSKGFISQIERNITSPSIATLVDILDTLGIDLKNFFSDTENKKVVFHKEDIFEQENFELNNKIKWIVPNAQKNNMEPILISLNINGKSETYNPHEGEIFGFVIKGSVRLFLGKENYKIKRGESFYYKANNQYYLQNLSNSESIIIWVSNPPNF